ncbi:MAG TPA: MFS transporter [Myxococcales bacterium]|jgi:predicted MFS family arabinose efflux permease
MSERRQHRFIVPFMALAAGATVANLFYNQPLLVEMSRSFGRPVGLVAAITQFGYSLGVLLLVPLGDRVELRRLIVILSLLTSGLLVAVGISHTPSFLFAASFALGAATIIPQLLVPFAAAVTEPRDRGRAVGTVAGGLLMGVLFSRVISGAMGERFGWRAVFFGAAVFMFALTAILRFVLPRQEPTTSLPYGALMRSLWELVVEEPVLRLHAILGVLTFASFNAFWTTLAPHLEAIPGHYGPQVAGLYGLLGVVGASAAPLVGRYSDKAGGAGFAGDGRSAKARSIGGGPNNASRAVNAVAIGVLLSSFAVLALGSESLWGLALAAILLDFGAQANHVSNQTRIVALREGARSRLNTIYMSVYVAGGASGSFMGTVLLRRFGYAGVVLCGTATGVGALALLFAATARGRRVVETAVAGAEKVR